MILTDVMIICVEASGSTDIISIGGVLFSFHDLEV